MYHVQYQNDEYNWRTKFEAVIREDGDFQILRLFNSFHTVLIEMH